MPDNPESEKFRIELPITKAGNRDILPVSGAFGAVNQQGNLIFHFYLEYPEMPISSTIEGTMDGKLLKETLNINMPPKAVREVVVTLAIPVPIALPLAELIKQQIAQYVENQKKQG